jgi:putative transposase
MTTPPCPSYAGHRFPAEIISYAVWLYFRFPLSLRHVDEILAARGITVSHEAVRARGLDRAEMRQQNGHARLVRHQGWSG